MHVPQMAFQVLSLCFESNHFSQKVTERGQRKKRNCSCPRGILANYMSALKPTADHQPDLQFFLQILLLGCVQFSCSKLGQAHSRADKGLLSRLHQPEILHTAKLPKGLPPQPQHGTILALPWFSSFLSLQSQRFRPPGKKGGREENHKMELDQLQFRVPGNIPTKTLQIHLNFHSELDYEVQIKFCFL